MKVPSCSRKEAQGHEKGGSRVARGICWPGLHALQFVTMWLRPSKIQKIGCRLSAIKKDRHKTDGAICLISSGWMRLSKKIKIKHFCPALPLTLLTPIGPDALRVGKEYQIPGDHLWFTWIDYKWGALTRDCISRENQTRVYLIVVTTFKEATQGSSAVQPWGPLKHIVHDFPVMRGQLLSVFYTQELEWSIAMGSMRGECKFHWYI